MKRILIDIVVIVLCGALFSAAMLVPMDETETADPQMLERADAQFLRVGVYLDGAHIYNWSLDHPVVAVNGQVYIPVDMSALNVQKTTDRIGTLQEGSLVVDEAAAQALSAPQDQADVSFASTGHLLWRNGNIYHEFNGFGVTTGYKSYSGIMLSSNKDIAVADNGTVYASADFMKNELGIDVLYVPGRGVYLSTDPSVSAQAWADSDTNADFVQGMADYIYQISNYLYPELTQWYAYLIMHVAAQNPLLTPNMIFAVCYVESHFDAGAGRNALGLMQILYKYAALGGITREMLLDPHINMELGSSQLNYLVESFGGDLTSAFAAYNMGAGAVRSNPNFSHSYADLIFKWMDNLESYLSSQGYATEFTEQLTLR